MILDAEPETDNGAVELDSVQGGFEFKDINFQYSADGRMILQDINFAVKPGETIALVGSSGSGKTTLVSLIARFYNHGQGNILLDGVDVNDFTLQNLRSHIAQVSQNVTLFNDSILNNIAYGELSDRSLAEVKAAATIAHADHFIEQLPEGYQTHIGDDGVMLSGGQRQRIAIARAVLKNAPVLILDEATSALDTDSERHIQAALEELMKSRTTFVIAHRLSTVEKADRILVMEKGRIVEQGSHQNCSIRLGATRSSTTISLASWRRADLVSGADHYQAWDRNSRWLVLLMPFAWLFSGLAALRRRYLQNKYQGRPYSAPVIVVGNISLAAAVKPL